jgi:stage III sporulation protein AG
VEAGKKVWAKLTKGKKMRKDQCLIMILTGVLLCVIALPVKKTETKSHISDMVSDTMEGKEDTSAEDADGKSLSDRQQSDYVSYWEEKLEDALSYVEGAGEVRVLITLKESEEKIVEKDGPEQTSDTAEMDAAGGSRTTKENSLEKTTIYMTDESGSSIPYVVKTVSPTVEGVVVIAQGGDQLAVRQNIIEAIQVLFDVDMNKITVVKMKNNHQ